MMCDVVVASETATWGFPEISLGCYLARGRRRRLASIAGSKARRRVDSDRPQAAISGREARGVGLGLCPARRRTRKCDSKRKKLAAQLAALSPAALAATKKAMYAWDSMQLRQGPGYAPRRSISRS
mgnify:CR=1 FL=1